MIIWPASVLAKFWNFSLLSKTGAICNKTGRNNTKKKILFFHGIDLPAKKEQDFNLPVVRRWWQQIQWQSKRNSRNGNHAKRLRKSMHPIGLSCDCSRIADVCTHIRQPSDWSAHWSCRCNAGIVLYFRIPAIWCSIGQTNRLHHSL